MSDRGPYLVFTIGPALVCLGLYVHYCRQVVTSRRAADAARRGPVGPYPTIHLAHLTDRQGSPQLYFLRFQLHPIGLARPNRGATVSTVTCPNCASAVTVAVRAAAVTRLRRCLWWAFATAAVVVAGVAAVIGAATFDPDGGAGFLLEPFTALVAILAVAIPAQRWQREDGVSLRDQPPFRQRLHSLRYRGVS